MEGTEDQCAIRRHDADKPSRILYHEGIRHASEFCRLADGENDWCREGESNPHSPFGPADFKSAASANFAIPARVHSSVGNVAAEVAGLECRVNEPIREGPSEWLRRRRCWLLANAQLAACATNPGRLRNS